MSKDYVSGDVFWKAFFKKGLARIEGMSIYITKPNETLTPNRAQRRLKRKVGEK